MKTLVLGWGNPILSDDGVGIRVAQQVREKVDDPQVTVAETSAAGLDLLDSVVGYDKAIIIDAIQTRDGHAGQIYRMGLQDFSSAKRFSSAHQMHLVTALELGKMLNLAMPREIIILAVEAEDITSFSEKCTPDVDRAIPAVVKMVLEELNAERPPQG
ncbi:MAG: hydrogenase maturation protease [Dehalococcoidia bacterium]|nr:MAG: hydrogenase maturation protease [Dehalococcoidia bacterium]